MSDRFAERREKLKKHLKDENLGVILVTDELNVRYLSGFTGDSSYMVISQENELILSDPRYTLQISEECPGLEAVIRQSTVPMLEATKNLLEPFANRSIAIEADSMCVSTFSKFEEKLENCKLVPTSGLIESFREIKDESEIESIRESIRTSWRAWNLVRAFLRPEMTELEIRDELDYRMRKFGSSEPAFDTIIASGDRAALPHAVPGEKILGENELLLFDWGAKRNGYVSDLTRTLITSKSPSEKLRTVYETVLKAQLAAIEAIGPGKKCCEIHEIAHGIITDAGFGEFFTHGLGHGIGLFIHEPLRLAPKQEKILKPGMVVTVEPGIYLEGWGGVRIEDDVLITETGHEVLSAYVPKSFEEMITDI